MNFKKGDVAETIECYIMENNLRPDDKLPSERSLCESCGASRTLVRAAINQLIQEGLLYSRVGSGTFVKGPKICRPLQTYIPFKTTVENEGRSFSTRVLSFQKIESDKNTARHLHLTIGHPVFELKRLRLIDGDAFMIDLSYIDAKRFQSLDEYDFSANSLYTVLKQAYKTPIYKGQEKLSVTFASEYESSLLSVKEGDALFYISGLARDDSDLPVEYAKVVIKKDLVMFSCYLRN